MVLTETRTLSVPKRHQRGVVARSLKVERNLQDTEGQNVFKGIFQESGEGLAVAWRILDKSKVAVRRVKMRSLAGCNICAVRGSEAEFTPRKVDKQA